MISKAETRNGSPSATSPQGAAVNVPIGLIDPHPQQPRQSFEDGELKALAESMKVDDLLQRPLVRAMPNGRYQLVAGERRCRAAKLAGWETMPVIVRELTDMEALKFLGTENLLRKDWTHLELARYLQTLCKPVEEGGAGMTRERASEVFGKSGTWAANMIRVLDLPTVWQQRVETDEISMYQAMKLTKYADKPSILKAVETDWKRSPWAWVGETDFARNVQAIAESGDKRQPRPRIAGQVPLKKGKTGPQPYGVDAVPDRAVDSLKKHGAKPNVHEVPFAGKPLTRINTPRICRILKPFMHDREMLVAIRDTCDRLIKELHGAKVETEAAIK